LIVNGGFETNGGAGVSDLTGWTIVDQVNKTFGTWYAQTGTTAPDSHLGVAAPPQGTFAAMGDDDMYASSVLYQDVSIPIGVNARLSLQRYVRSGNDMVGTCPFVTPPSLDFGYDNYQNQQARIDIMDPSASVDDVGSGVLLNVFRTNVGDVPISGYSTVTADLTPFAGQTIRLRFAFVSGTCNLMFGVDSVSIATSSHTATSVPHCLSGAWLACLY